ncbi:MAG: copper amine oxidase N-terminal domain-containing protein [Syntrophomonadaceae bacterium]|nr:copper amine oxidase N-terminal domain-containing protein [Syntrophomonadaceae bacterium]
MSSTVGVDKNSVTEKISLEPGCALCTYRVRAYKLFLNSDPSNTVVFNIAASSGGSPGGTPGGSPGVNGQVDLDFFIGKASYNINGSASAMDVSPVIKENRTLLPIRFITEPIGADIQWIDAEKKVIINQSSTIIELWIGKNKAEINGRSVPIDPDNSSVMPLIINGRTMMPLRFIAENLGCEVKWIPENSQIIIHYQGDKLDPQPEPPM